MANQVTIKRNISTVEITLKVKASKINENGTFSSFEVVQVTGPNKAMKAVAPPQGGGAIYIKTESLDGIKILDDAAKVNTEKKKLF